MDFDPFGVSLFQGSSLVIVIMIDGSEKHNCEVRMLVKSAAKSQCSQRPPDQAGSMGSWLSVLVYFWFSYNTIFLSSVNQLRPSHFTLVERQQFLEFPVTSN